MDNRTRNRIWTLAVALLVALPVAQGLTMKDDPWDASAGGGGGGGYGGTPAPELRSTGYAVDLTMGYDPVITREQQGIQDAAYGTNATLEMTKDLAGAQFGVFRTLNGFYPLGAPTALSDGQSTAATVRVIPAQGWFPSVIRTPDEIDGNLNTMNVGLDRFQRASNEFFKVQVTARGDPNTVGSSNLTCANQREFNVFAGTVAGPAGMAVNFKSQMGESMAENVPESHRNEGIELVIKSHQSVTGIRCMYEVKVSMYLRNVFEVRHDSPRNPLNLQDPLGDPNDPESDPGGTFTDYILGLNSRVEIHGAGISNTQPFKQPVRILYAPVLPARWICESLRQAPGGVGDATCTQMGMNEANTQRVLFQTWRAAANNGYFLQASYILDGVTRAETHFVADVGTVSIGDSLLHTVTESGVVSDAWPQ
jgi:hypothetical protein